MAVDSEVWDSRNYIILSDYFVRAMRPGVIDDLRGGRSSLSFDSVVRALRSYACFDLFKNDSNAGTMYFRGKVCSPGIVVEVLYEECSGLARQLDLEEERFLEDVRERGYVSTDDSYRLAVLDNSSVPLISVKISYPTDISENALEVIRRRLLPFGLDKI